MPAPRDPALPPGPPLPRLVQSLLVLGPAEPFLRACRRRYGGAFTMRLLFGPPSVVVSDPALVRAVFTGPPDVLRAGESNAFLQPLVGDRSVLLLDGGEHLRARRLLLPPFHGRSVAHDERIVVEATRRSVATWPVGAPFPLLPAMQDITLEVILRAVLGIEDEERRRRFTALTRATLAPLWVSPARLLLAALRGRWSPERSRGRAFAGRIAELDAALYAEIDRRRAETGLAEADDVLAMLLRATDEDGAPLSDRELRDELVTLLLAGHETTATSLAWAFERLLRHPAVLATTAADAAAGSDRWLDAVVRETLRTRPIIPAVGRILRAPWALGEHVLPAGVEVSPSAVLVHFDERTYPAARTFDPLRFLDRAPDTYAWLPFGGGTRRCLGASFALMELRTVLREVLTTTTLAPARRRGERIVRRGIVIAPADGARVVRSARAPDDPRTGEAASARPTLGGCPKRSTSPGAPARATPAPAPPSPAAPSSSIPPA
jgi:cytochrome P450